MRFQEREREKERERERERERDVGSTWRGVAGEPWPPPLLPRAQQGTPDR